MKINMIIMWVLLVFALLGGAMGMHFIFTYYIRNNKLRKEVDTIVKDVRYMRKMFDSHFETTNETILDLREQRVKLEKERDSLKSEVENLRKRSK